ncbi:hypothetical protein NST50_05320 [Paenibacillus sp. FSL E2-0202]|uniref:phage adaptor protein n=1 Tax=Paenibacillus sp. FSL E2-0202 TaxID=2954505 RepID=UPI0030EB47F6
MKVSDVVEEIIEKSPHFLSPQSILRKITAVRDRLLRQSMAAQRQSSTVCTAIDLHAGQIEYVPPCSPDSVVDVDVRFSAYRGGDCKDYRRIPLRQFDQRAHKPYYYFTAGKIGIMPVPEYDAAYGIKIFHLPVLNPLTFEDMEGDTGFDPDYDMLLVYGVLREITSGNEAQENNTKYLQLLADYTVANSGYETHEVKERW